MTDDFNPTEWITTKEAAELTGYNLEYIRLRSAFMAWRWRVIRRAVRWRE